MSKKYSLKFGLDEWECGRLVEETCPCLQYSRGCSLLTPRTVQQQQVNCCGGCAIQVIEAVFTVSFMQLTYSSATLYSYSIKWLVVLQIISLCRLQFILFLSIIMHNCRFAISLFSDHLLCQVLNFHYSCGSGSAFFLQIFESRLENRS